MIRILSIIILTVRLFPVPAKCQQDYDPYTFFGQIKDIKEMENLRISSWADSSAFYDVFTDSFAKKALAYQVCWKLISADEPRYRNSSLDSNFINIQLKEIEVANYSTEKFKEYPWFDAKKKLFKNENIMFYDISRGDGSRWAYFARYWTYINGRWVTFENLPGLLYEIINSNEIPRCGSK